NRPGSPAAANNKKAAPTSPRGCRGRIAPWGGGRRTDSLALRDGARVLAQEVERSRLLGRKLRRDGQGFPGRRLRYFGQELDIAVALEPGSRRDETSHDDVLLEPPPVID